MRNFGLVVITLLLPALAIAQGTVKVSSVYGPVEWKAVTATVFVPLQASVRTVHPGDEIRTGPGGSLILELPDNSYAVVAENSTFTIEDFGGTGLRTIVNRILGKARFYIQNLGGKPNSDRIQTPTALIAVRG